MGITDSPGFCVLPWMHLNMRPDGRATLCCQSNLPVMDHGRELNAQTYALADIWNSDGVKDLRRRMANGEKLPHCDACFHNEQHGAPSYRHESRARWLDGDAELRRAIETAKDWALDTGPLYFDLRLGNLCNLKCTVCKPLYSSQIERDPVHAAWGTDAPHLRLPSRFADDGDWSQADALVDEIMGLSSDLRMILLAGGEPTINKTQMRWLRRLTGEGRASGIDLEVTTNLSNLHPEVLDSFRQFKSLTVDVSIDGFGPTYEYVRFPGKWATLTRNMARLKAARPDATISLVCVLQAINGFNLVELFQWAQDQDIAVRILIGRGLDHYNDFRIVPPAVRDQIRERMADYFHRQGNRGGVAALRERMAAVFAEIDATDFADEQRREYAVGLMQFVNDMDRTRGLSFKAVAPEVYAAIVEYHGQWDESCRYAVAG